MNSEKRLEILLRVSCSTLNFDLCVQFLVDIRLKFHQCSFKVGT